MDKSVKFTVIGAGIVIVLAVVVMFFLKGSSATVVGGPEPTQQQLEEQMRKDVELDTRPVPPAEPGQATPAASTR